MVKLNPSSVFFAANLLSLATAHPGEHEHHDHESVAQHNEYAKMIKRGLSACASHPNYLALQDRAQQRRWTKAQHLRAKRGLALDAPFRSRLRRRDLAALEADEKINHNMTSKGFNKDTAAAKLFASYKNSSCILAPEVTFGPYWVEGEYYRSDVVDGQPGVPIHLEYQYIDVNTCTTPTSELYIEHWSANSTGVYSGVIASGNGDDSDLTNIDKTFLRGVTKVEDGVGTFDAIFPGHYSGRTTHIHLITHIGGTVFKNNTYKGSNVAHVGQLFFDEDLKSAVEATYPYNTNTQTATTNDEDQWAPSEADNDYDPLPDWAYLGNDISDGLLMWITVAVNMSSSYTVTPAATLTENGGVADSGDALGGSGGSGGAAPSGGMGGSAGGAAPSGGMGGASPPGGSGSPPGSNTSTTTKKHGKATKSATKKGGKVTTTKKAGGKATAAPKKHHSSTAKEAGHKGKKTKHTSTEAAKKTKTRKRHKQATSAAAKKEEKEHH
ncbi:hypothetical protein ANO11243_089470 [Dothideomycetidae sp. 11243]|nr:hypothetical protein ANO11243_089470 [fungal sp. No.11243]